MTEVSPEDDAVLIIPGGTLGADRLRGNAGIVSFARRVFEQETPVVAI